MPTPESVEPVQVIVGVVSEASVVTWRLLGAEGAVASITTLPFDDQLEILPKESVDLTLKYQVPSERAALV